VSKVSPPALSAPGGFARATENAERAAMKNHSAAEAADLKEYFRQ
jgi:hypothetical protein